MPSLRERLTALAHKLAHDDAYVGQEHVCHQAAAVLAAAEAWANAKHTELAEYGDNYCNGDDLKLLALFPPPAAKETP